jgi:serine/threonine-protein kinase
LKSVRSDAAEMIHALVVDEARLRHANILSTLDVLVDGATVHVIMEHVEGSCLGEILGLQASSGQRLPPAVAATVLHDVLVGLEHAHGAHDETMGLANMLHCDVSPENVIVGFDGLTRIVDLGLPRTKSSDDAPGRSKVAYLAPEQLAGSAVDRTADIYVCGILLWELLAGARLFDAVRADEPIARPSSRARGVPRALEAVAMRALSHDPRERFGSASAMAKAIEKAIRLASRSSVSEAVRALSRPDAAVDSDATLSERLAMAGSAVRSTLSSATTWAFARVERGKVAGRLTKMRALVSQLSFSTRVLLAFSAVSLVILASIAGSTRTAPMARAATATTTLSAQLRPPPTPPEPPPIEIDDEPRPAPAPSATVATVSAVAAKPRLTPRAAPRPPQREASKTTLTAALLH